MTQVTVLASIAACICLFSGDVCSVELSIAIANNKPPPPPAPITFLVKRSFRLMPVWHSKGYLSLSLSSPRFYIYIVFPSFARLHAPGFYNGESTVYIGPKWPLHMRGSAFEIIGIYMKCAYLPFEFRFVFAGFWGLKTVAEIWVSDIGERESCCHFGCDAV